MTSTVLMVLLLVEVSTSATNYVIAPIHEGDGGSEFKIVCPFNGAITEISYRSGSVVDQIGFVCTSSTGKTTLGPYGGDGGSAGNLKCPQGQYISSFYGQSGSKLDRLGIRCRDQNDLNNYGTSRGEFGGSGGSSFDDLSYSIGSRPISVVVRAGSIVDAIQITYGNVTNKLFCTNCNQYTEMWAPKHGGGGGSLNSFVCPQEGVITGIRYRSGASLDSIQFTCTSAVGESTMGPYGGNGGSGPLEDKCPLGSYIGSIHGRRGASVDQLGIRCVKYGQVGSSPKRDAHGGNGGSPFDDETYAINGHRPVEIRVWSGSIVDAIQIKYANLPVAIDCKISNIQVTDQSIIAQPDGYEVIGLASGSTCSSIQQSLNLQSTQTVGESIGVETTEGGEFNWATTVSFTFTMGVDLGAKSEISVGLSQTLAGSRSWSYTHTISTSTESSSSLGTQINYQGPGACLVIGYLNRYKINKDNVPVRYSFQCEGGSISPQTGTIRLTRKMFGKADFQDYHFSFKDTASCTSQARSCVAAIKASNVNSDPGALQNEFYKCFPSNSGTAFRK